MKYLPWAIITVAVLILVIYSFVKFIRFYKNKIFKLQVLNKKIDELYYFTSKNHQMLTQLTEGKRDFPRYSFDDSWTKGNPVICHALGEIDGVLFTECKEAFEKHYHEGCRVFELDFSLTRDGIPVVVHDWRTFNGGMVSNVHNVHNTFLTEYALKYEDFEKTKILGKYTTLTLERFVKLAEEYDDAWFIISVKSVNQRYDDSVHTIFKELFRMTDKIKPDIKKRYILHAYSFEFLYSVMNEFKFNSAVYRGVNFIHPNVLAEELKRCGITTTTTTSVVYARRDYCKILHDNGIKIIGCVVTKDIKNRLIREWIKSDVDMLMVPFGRNFNEKI